MLAASNLQTAIGGPSAQEDHRSTGCITRTKRTSLLKTTDDASSEGSLHRYHSRSLIYRSHESSHVLDFSDRRASRSGEFALHATVGGVVDL